MTNDIFDNTILCRKCGTKMQKAQMVKNNFLFRVLVCPKCHEKIIHPTDEQEYNKFVDLKNKEFHVKMRLVGNSYAVSIPKEIVSFMREQEEMMDDMVKLCFQDTGRLSLDFNKPETANKSNPNGSIESNNPRVIREREYQVIKNNKPTIHVKEFSDSANPKNNRIQIIKNKSLQEREE